MQLHNHKDTKDTKINPNNYLWIKIWSSDG